METETLFEKVRLMGIVPVVTIQDVQSAEPLARALVEAGLPCAEITFRTAAAKESIRRMADTFPQMLLGAGTVLTIEQAKGAVEAGATFLVSPGFNPRIVDWALEQGVPIVPGVATPSEVEQGLERGLSVLKFFPAEANGGLPYLKALWGPYPNVRFMPTGGIDSSNLGAYLRQPRVLACGGSWMVPADRIAQGQFDQIRQLVATATLGMLELQVDGVNISAAADASEKSLSQMLGLDGKHGEKTSGRTVTTPFLDRALSFLERRGFRPDDEKFVPGKTGSTISGIRFLGR